MKKSEYLKKLKDPRWQKKRLEVFERDLWACQVCFDTDSTLNVHHRYYLKDHDPWDYPLGALVSLCEGCHNYERENRYKEEGALLHALKKHFFSENIYGLARYFEKAELLHAPEVIVDVLGFFLCDKKTQTDLIEKFFKHVSKEHKKK